jgi:UDP-glucose 4-epimerase
MTKIIVTGAAGFIGSHMVEYLVKKNEVVMGLDVKRYPKHLYDLESKVSNLTLYDSDINEDDLTTYINKGDKILHLAAMAHFVTFEKATQAVRANVIGTIRLIQAAIKQEAERLVYSSTGSVYALDVRKPIIEFAHTDPPNAYGISKKQAEDWIQFKQSELPFVILRYGYIFGTRKDWGAIGHWLYHNIPEGNPPRIYGGKQTNDFLYIKDLLEANWLALETDNLNLVHNIGSGEEVSIEDTCKWCVEAVNSPLKPAIEPARNFDYSRFIYDTSHATEHLGFTAKWNTQEGIIDMVAEMEREKNENNQ